MTTKPRATIEDLYDVPEHQKAELVRGEVVLLSPTGDLPNRASLAISVRLKEYERASRSGRAYTGNAGFRVHLPHRESFSPDAAYYVGPRAGGRFLEGAPIFAAEVRSESDFGERAEKAPAESAPIPSLRKRQSFGMSTSFGKGSSGSTGQRIRRVRPSTGVATSPKPSPTSRDFGWQSTSFSISRVRPAALTFPDPTLE